MSGPRRRLWPFTLAGALLPLLALVARQVGQNEGGDVLLVAGPMVLIVGAVLGTLLGLVCGARPRA